MKVIKLLVLGIILAGAAYSSNPVKAAGVDSAVSSSTISFIPDEGTTNPVDPEDPDNPDPPWPIDPEDPGNGGTGSIGALTLDYVSNIQFGTQKIASGNITYYALNKNPFVQVTDKRGTGEGWSLKAQASEFTSEDRKVLAGAILSFRNGRVKSLSGNVSAPPEAYDVVFDNMDAKPVMMAEEGAGRGTWVDVFTGTGGDNRNVQLKVLEGSADTLIHYTAEITWELSNAPS
ncbi:WxL domain-containing protein [Bacillus sp. FJAT-28004]|uniref:WxL domain-containing protein n=1 Tax=Bacillus sp. FJAT-28004 TaxID=1679165 RepID=UPI0006B48EEA|nr:WxL domain-containing protein [Bacillus sp. FJAT-28004]